MNLKYYLRGLGVGVVVTAVIMGIALGGRKEELSDEQIIAKASALGMIAESTTLKDLEEMAEMTDEKVPEVIPEATDKNVPEVTPGVAEEKTPEITPGVVEEKTPEVTPEIADKKTPEVMPEASPGKTPEKVMPEDSSLGVEKNTLLTKEVTIVIKSGQGSYDVCMNLEAEGVIDSAIDFDRFLCSKGYDKKISAGTHIIPAGANEEEIAEVLTNK